MAELVSSSRVAEITGFKLRWVQAHAPTIPGATKFGGHWRFDETAVRLWVAAGARKKSEWQPYIKEARRSGVGFSTEAKSSASRLKQRLGLSP